MQRALSPADFGFVRVAAAVPPLKVADITYNLGQTLAFARRADEQGVQILVFPELGLTGYTAGDLFHQHLLLDRASGRAPGACGRHRGPPHAPRRRLPAGR